MFVIEHGFEHGSHRDFRLAVPDIAAHQTVHGLFGFHVPFDVFDRAQLVRRFLVFKGRVKFVRENRIRREGHAPSHLAGRLDCDQIFGHLLDAFARPALGPLPGLSAEVIQFRRAAF